MVRVRRRARWGMNHESESDPQGMGGITFQLGDESQDHGPPPEDGPLPTVGNHVYFYRDVTTASVTELVVCLRGMGAELRKHAIDLDGPPAPIHLHIQSDGGDLFAGMAAMDAIQSSPVPVYTHVDGKAASAATLLSVAGHRRFISRHAFILIHQLSGGAWGKFEELKDHMANSTLLMETVRGVYKQRTLLDGDRLDDLLKRDLWLSADLALEYGLVDEIG